MSSDTHNGNRRAGALSLAAALLAAGLTMRATSGPAAWIVYGGDRSTRLSPRSRLSPWSQSCGPRPWTRLRPPARF